MSEANLREFRENFGDKTCLMGNISVVETLLYKNAKEVYEDTYQACMDAAVNGNYIVGPDCGTPAAIKEENIRAMYQASEDATKFLFGKR